MQMVIWLSVIFQSCFLDFHLAYNLKRLNDIPMRLHAHDALVQIHSKLIQADLENANQSQNHQLTEISLYVFGLHSAKWADKKANSIKNKCNLITHRLAEETKERRKLKKKTDW